ncbi:hypothetical protein [Dermatobacter hominis]|uniref:hypothetical protein n=1 Tax=Dermatobacter hominis TaxID=2884263 RepID=UPI001D11FBA6|nr:hypothetical protein [Dermatobacter hominis]UDY34035.1 hypothetical protein LH044_11835 [Dermatobacter hominis]
MLVGIVVMVPLTLASVTGLLLGMRVSTGNEVAQQLEVALTTAGEDLKSVPYLSCGTPEEYQELLDGWDDVLSVELVSSSRPLDTTTVDAVEYWDSSSGRFRTKCNADDGAQRLTITVRGRDGSTTGTTVKRNAAVREPGAG